MKSIHRTAWMTGWLLLALALFSIPKANADYLWTAQGNGTLRVFNPANGKVLHQISLPSPNGSPYDFYEAVAFGDQRLWTLQGSGRLCQVEPATGKLVQQFLLPLRSMQNGNNPDEPYVGLAFANGFLWVLQSDGRLSQVDPSSGKILQMFRLPAPGFGVNDSYTGLSFGSQRLWASQGNGQVSEVSLSDGRANPILRLRNPGPLVGDKYQDAAYGEFCFWFLQGKGALCKSAFPDAAVLFRWQLPEPAIFPDDLYKGVVYVDTTPPTGGIRINCGAEFTNCQTVRLDLPAQDNSGSVVLMQLANDGEEFGAWEPYVNTKLWALTPEDGLKTVFVRYRDESGNESCAYAASIYLDTVPPFGDFRINGGAAVTSNPTAWLEICARDDASGVSEMQFSMNGGCWGDWMPYAQRVYWDMPTTNGLWALYIRFRDRAGNESCAAAHEILLDLTPPTGSIVTNCVKGKTEDPIVSVSLTAYDGESGVAGMRLSDGSRCTGWAPFTPSVPWALSPGYGGKTISVQFIDNAGNVS
ncbi:MAG: PQQ-binding-like beta-propeller repeat protein, partial [Candidatus Sumerlaeota bacterium]|nr:PQQ-binding-like beta-propeller repeat protein [Candidatus Sumerlaeota bacterium]